MIRGSDIRLSGCSQRIAIIFRILRGRMSNSAKVFKNKFFIIGAITFVITAISISVICILLNKRKLSPEEYAVECIDSQISEAFSGDSNLSESTDKKHKSLLDTSGDSDEEEDFVLYELQEDGTGKMIEDNNPIDKLADAIFSKMTYTITEIGNDSCTLVVKAPDYKALFCKIYNMNPETFEFSDNGFDPNTDYRELMIEAIKNDDFDYIENTVTVPMVKGVPMITYELADAFYGNMYSFSEELLDKLSEKLP